MTKLELNIDADYNTMLPLAEELLHYVLSEFLSKPDVKSIVMSGSAFFYCLRIATNSWKSTTSPFYRTYRDPNLKISLNDNLTAWIKDSEYDESQNDQEEVEEAGFGRILI